MMEYKFSNLSLCDEEGMVFKKDDKFFRGIFNSQASILKFIQSTSFKNLQVKGFLPETFIVDNNNDQTFASILEHESANFVTYPHEWSFDMFKDACLFFLQLVEESVKNGHTIKDGHLYNIVFFNSKPKFVDIGSVVPSSGDIPSLNQFKQTALIPLMIWAKGYYLIANSLIRDDNGRVSLEDTFSIYKGLILANSTNIKGISKYLETRKVEFPMVWERNTGKLIHAIQSLKQEHQKSSWENYHKEYINQGKIIKTTPRFDTIVSIIKSLDVKSVYDVACNEGLLSLLVSERCENVEKIISSDFDENAINHFYLFLKENPVFNNITVAVSNFMTPTHSFQEDLPEERFQCDCVVALALTHHLILGQKFHIQAIAKRFASFTKKYLIIEFMPLGLWGGGTDPYPVIPDYYTENWYLNAFAPFFEIMDRKELETNRVCFVLKKK